MWLYSACVPKQLIFLFFLEPKSVIDYLQTLKSSDESLREQVWYLLLPFLFFLLEKHYLLCTISCMFSSCYQLEKAKRKEAAFIVKFAKREQEIADLKVRIFWWSYTWRAFGQISFLSSSSFGFIIFWWRNNLFKG